MQILTAICSSLGVGGILLFFIKRYFDKKDKQEAEDRAARDAAAKAAAKKTEEFHKRIETSLETIRLLSYSRMSEEIERLLTKGYATPAERRVLEQMYDNYKAHGLNGDMDARMHKVHELRTDHAPH